MRVENNGLRRTRGHPFTINHRRNFLISCLKQPGIQTSLAHSLNKKAGVSADIWGVGNDVRDGEESNVFSKETMFVGLQILAD